MLLLLAQRHDRVRPRRAPRWNGACGKRYGGYPPTRSLHSKSSRSVGVTATNKLPNMRPAAKLMPSPSAEPSAATTKLSFNTVSKICRELAPSARRIPKSRVRRAVWKATTA